MSEEEAQSTLGERLLSGVQNLWKEVQRLGKVTDATAVELEAYKRRLDQFERELHGLKISRGRARAKNARLEAQLAEAEMRSEEIRQKLN